MPSICRVTWISVVLWQFDFKTTTGAAEGEVRGWPKAVRVIRWQTWMSGGIDTPILTSYRWWRTGCVAWWPHYLRWTSRSARICFVAQSRFPTGCTRTRRGNSRSLCWRKPSLSCRRSWETTGTASKSWSCRWDFHIDLVDLGQLSATILSTALRAWFNQAGAHRMLWQCDVFFLKARRPTQLTVFGHYSALLCFAIMYDFSNQTLLNFLVIPLLSTITYRGNSG